MVRLKKISILGGIALFALPFLTAGSIFFETNKLSEIKLTEDKLVPGEVLVLTKESDLSDEELTETIKSSSPVLIQSVEKLHKSELQKSVVPHGKRFLTLKFNEDIDPNLVAQSIRNNPFVVFAEPNLIGALAWMPNDLFFPAGQWGLHNIGQSGGTPDADIDAPEAWDIETGISSTVIAIIDTGVELTHQDLVSKLLPGWDPAFNDFVPEDDHGHGTMMAGVAVAATNNSLGVAGTCPSCMILPIKVGWNSGGTEVVDLGAVYKALEFAVGNPQGIEGIPVNPYFADVISMSIGFLDPSTLLQQGVLDAYNAGAALVVAAGNYNNSFYTYPAAYDEVIAVAATNKNDARASGSNYGTWVDIAAPGDAMTTYLNNSYAGVSGTSVSTPFTAGVIGLMLSRPNAVLTATQIRQALIDTSDPATGFPAIAGGRVNAYRALTTNIAPIMTSMGNKIIKVTKLLVIDVNASDGNGDNLIYSTDAADVLPSPFSFDPQTGIFSWQPTAVGQYVVNFAVTDGRGGFDSETIVITVKGGGGVRLPSSCLTADSFSGPSAGTNQTAPICYTE